MRDQNDNNEQDNNPNPMGRNLIVWMIFLLMLVAVFNMFNRDPQGMAGLKSMPYSDFITQVDNKQIESVTIAGSLMEVRKTGGDKFGVIIPQNTDVVSRIEGKGVVIEAKPDTSGSPPPFKVLFSRFPMQLFICVWC